MTAVAGRLLAARSRARRHDGLDVATARVRAGRRHLFICSMLFGLVEQRLLKMAAAQAALLSY